MAFRTVLGSPSAAGAEVNVQVPGGERWRVQAVQATLVTSAVVANRTVDLAVDDGVSEVFRHSAAAVQAAGLTQKYVYGARLGYEWGAFRAGMILAGLPDLLLDGGARIRTVTGLLDVGDRWSSVLVYVEVTRPEVHPETVYAEGVPALGQS